MRIAVLLAFPAIAAGANCEDLAKLALSDTTITTAQSVPAGSFTPPIGPPLPNLPAFCRVALTLKPSSDSNIEVEVWLPSSGWNEKFQGVGNGGFAGVISFGNMAAVLKSSGVARTRPLCPYPQVAQWKGAGSTDDERNFVCAQPRQ